MVSLRIRGGLITWHDTVSVKKVFYLGTYKTVLKFGVSLNRWLLSPMVCADWHRLRCVPYNQVFNFKDVGRWEIKEK